jgi:hypothetical protein
VVIGDCVTSFLFMGKNLGFELFRVFEKIVIAKARHILSGTICVAWGVEG